MLESTGERYLPAQSGQIKYEHLHRYAISLPLVAGRSALDIASGEGYGSALLARVAREVAGVDVDAQAVAHAVEKYSGRQNLRYLQGSCAAIPLPDHSVEVITSFETIEHHNQHEEMMREIKRVLAPGGLLIISSPNKQVYSDIPGYHNPFHVKELYYDEFAGLIGRHFQHARFYGQRQAAASFVFRLEGGEPEQEPATALQIYSGADETLKRQMRPLPEPLYFVAVCSDDPRQVEPPVESVYLDADDDLLKDLTRWWTEEREARRQDRQAWEEREAHLVDTVASSQATIRQLSKQIDDIAGSNAWRLMQALWRARTLFRTK
jgi:ubiquinone/menaquinone biosynthesis C-methylase UbiE